MDLSPLHGKIQALADTGLLTSSVVKSNFAKSFGLSERCNLEIAGFPGQRVEISSVWCSLDLNVVAIDSQLLLVVFCTEFSHPTEQRSNKAALTFHL